MKKRLGALAILTVIAAATAAQAGVETGTARCDTWHRRSDAGSTNGTHYYKYTDHNHSDSTDTVQDLPAGQRVKLMTGPWVDTSVSRYGAVVTSAPDASGRTHQDAWVETIGGGGYGSQGYPYPDPASGEGGLVQGDAKASEVDGAPDVNFSVWSFSGDDEQQGYDGRSAITGACVSAGGNTVSLGKAPNSSQTAYNSTTQTGCTTDKKTSTRNCWGAPHGNCDPTITVSCDGGIEIPLP